MQTILFTLAIIILFVRDINTRRQSKDRFESLRGRLSSTDEHLHKLIDRADTKDSKGMSMILAILGKRLHTHTDDKYAFIVEDVKTGKKQIGSLSDSKVRFFSLTEKKEKKGYKSAGRFSDRKEYEFKVDSTSTLSNNKSISL